MPETTGRHVRVATTDWTDFGASATAQGTDRTKLINEFIAWYLGRPGARLPERPGSHAEPEAGQLVRVAQEIWLALAPDAKTPAERQALINDVLAWYLRRPNARSSDHLRMFRDSKSPAP
ncbi:hypothetical protein HD597_011330 [Nonomuraea thailandensis]|uniref:Uncharacterized protein n=1 Tax=Nonomuraea thailandensis TaxID=1188745 RepID=A0A9X2GUU3_9ACTN|nr:hypothetical protein [Nonomuraea thailandensis]MCP2364310.1 hypothetical protein [Nonomuraea thailandensis]